MVCYLCGKPSKRGGDMITIKTVDNGQLGVQEFHGKCLEDWNGKCCVCNGDMNAFMSIFTGKERGMMIIDHEMCHAGCNKTAYTKKTIW